MTVNQQIEYPGAIVLVVHVFSATMGLRGVPGCKLESSSPFCCGLPSSLPPSEQADTLPLAHLSLLQGASQAQCYGTTIFTLLPAVVNEADISSQVKQIALLDS